MKKDRNCSVIIIIFLFTVLVGLSSPTQTSAEDRIAVENFVTRFYELCFGRSPDSTFLNGWVTGLLDGYLTASDISYGIVFSTEFENRNATAEEYITILYKAILNRTPNPADMEDWLNILNNGASRDYVLNEFLHTEEFEELCEEYSIKAFDGHFTKNQISAVEAFVTRFYILCLGRTPDATGLQEWAISLLSKKQTAIDVAFGFVYSQEFIHKNTTDEEYLKILYKVFFNRHPDPVGFNDWISELKAGISRGEVLDTFISSEEFSNLAKAYGIELGLGPLSGFLYGTIFDVFTGQPIENSTIIINSHLESGIKDLRFHCLPDGKYIFPPLLPGLYSLMVMAPGYNTKFKSEIVLQEAEMKAVELKLVPASAVEDFVKRFYKMCLSRDPDKLGLEIWTNNLLNHIQTGADVAHGFIDSIEFNNKDTTNYEYLAILYKAFFDRKPDQAGWDVWIAELDSGKERGYVLDGFLYSPEFIRLCEDYGIIPY